MVFSDLFFLFRFLPVVLLIYFVSPRKFRNFILFVTSLFFYAWGEPIYVLLMLFSTGVDFTLGKLVYKYKNTGKLKAAKKCVIASVIINLSLLGFFKYTDFLIGSINNIFGLSIDLLHVALPIGISFYTFQTMSYTLDIYMNNEKPQGNMISFGAYVAMFPQLIAGPIVQYRMVSKELVSRKENFDDFAIGVRKFILGIGKKVLLANNVGAVWSLIKTLNETDMSVVLSWIGIICFGLQIYYDFSGYSDMAIGLGKMFGFNFPVNFDYPYLSKSITEFFRRWHISLGKWFREYVYIPLGGNRKGLKRQIRNIFIVWCLTGIWHGAAYNFIIWGVYFGILLILEKIFLLKWLSKIPTFFSRIYTIVTVLIGWVFFEYDKLPDIGRYLSYMFFGKNISFINDYSIFMILNSTVLIIIAILGATDIPNKLTVKIMNKIEDKPFCSMLFENIFLIGIFLIAVSYLVAGSYNPFLYFRF